MILDPWQLFAIFAITLTPVVMMGIHVFRMWFTRQRFEWIEEYYFVIATSFIFTMVAILMVSSDLQACKDGLEMP